MDKKQDVAAKLQETAPGRYEARILVAPGARDLLLTAEQGGREVFRSPAVCKSTNRAMSLPALDYDALVTRGKDGALRFEAAIEGMTCAACIGEIETSLRNLPGMPAARVNYTNRRLSLEWREGCSTSPPPSSGCDAWAIGFGPSSWRAAK